MSSGLQTKSLTTLRGIAQSLGVTEVFQKDAIQLVQAIELKQAALLPREDNPVPKPQYDARLMTMPPAEQSEREEAERLLEPYRARGLHVTFDDECWYMSLGKKQDSGTIRMPLRTLLGRADRMLGDQ